MVKRERSRTQDSTYVENLPEEVMEIENYGMNLMEEMSPAYFLKERKMRNKKNPNGDSL